MEALRSTRRGLLRPLLVVLLVGAVLLLPGLSCAFMPEFLVDKEGTATAEKLFVESRLESTRQVERAQAATLAVEQTATRAAEQISTAQAHATATHAASATAAAHQHATLAAQTTATRQAADGLALAEQYVAEGRLPASDGIYYALEDFEQAKNDVGAYIWWRSEHQPRVFVLRSRLDYEVPPGPLDRTKAACGFMLWENGAGDWLRVVYTLEGYVQTNALIGNRYIGLGQSYHALPPVPGGSLDLTLVANEEWLYVYIDDELVKRTEIPSQAQRGGYLSYTLSSGSTREFGMRCRFSGSSLWVIE